MLYSPRILKQLGHPTGITGKIILRLLNRVNQGMNNATLSALDLIESDNVLEIGFGGSALIGRILTTHKTINATGVDISALAVKIARKRFRNNPRVNFEQITDETLLADNASYTRIACVNVIYFWSNVPFAFNEALRVLTDGGKFVLCYSEGSPDGVSKFNHKDVESKLIAAGFASVRSTQHSESGNGTYYCTVALRASLSPAE